MIALLNIDLFRFLFVGIGANLINYSIYMFFLRVGFPLLVASAAGYVAGLICSYHFGRIWVFGDKFEISKGNVFRFLAVYAVGGLGMCSIIELLARTFEVNHQASWLVGALFAVVNNFFGLKKLVFNKEISK